jgi:hypothetical protein
MSAPPTTGPISMEHTADRVETDRARLVLRSDDVVDEAWIARHETPAIPMEVSARRATRKGARQKE